MKKLANSQPWGGHSTKTTPLKNEQKESIVNLLWTGGFDSTYRLIELSMRDVTIQPVYVVDSNRGSMAREQEAMDTILEKLNDKEGTKATILPIKKIKLEDIPENEEITNAYLLFKKEADMGIQHDWIARLAVDINGLEICIEKALGDHAPIRNSILRHGKLIDTGDGFIVDKEKSSKELNLILGNLKLPIFNKTNLEMLEDIKKWGYEDVISCIWFCHQPINGKPCGLCNPCNTKIDAKLDFMLPSLALKRSKRMRRINKIFGETGKKIYIKFVRKVSGKIWN